MPIQMKTIQEIFFSEKGHLKNENAILFIYLFSSPNFFNFVFVALSNLHPDNENCEFPIKPKTDLSSHLHMINFLQPGLAEI